MKNKFNEGSIPRKMIGSLGNIEYVDFENDRWRHDESDWDSEEIVLDALYERKIKYEESASSKKMEKGKKIIVNEVGDDDASDDKGGDGGEPSNLLYF
ncbi:hypothetical protein Hanom_Chr06g00526901 [Helianthus anomalus]